MHTVQEFGTGGRGDASTDNIIWLLDLAGEGGGQGGKGIAVFSHVGQGQRRHSVTTVLASCGQHACLIDIIRLFASFVL